MNKNAELKYTNLRNMKYHRIYTDNKTIINICYILYYTNFRIKYILHSYQMLLIKI